MSHLRPQPRLDALSGGALVNLRGELVGINAQILSQTGGNIGIGFAIPSTIARAVTEQLMQDGVVRRAKLGVTVQPLNAGLARSLGLEGVHGALVSGVEAGSPGERAGVQPGDVIKQVDGRAVASVQELRTRLAASPDRPALLLLARRGNDLFVALPKSAS